jgi:hypothetical protein
VHGLPCVEYNSAALEGVSGSTGYCEDPAAVVPHEDVGIGFCCDEAAPGLAPMGEA